MRPVWCSEIDYYWLTVGISAGISHFYTSTSILTSISARYLYQCNTRTINVAVALMAENETCNSDSSLVLLPPFILFSPLIEKQILHWWHHCAKRRGWHTYGQDRTSNSKVSKRQTAVQAHSHIHFITLWNEVGKENIMSSWYSLCFCLCFAVMSYLFLQLEMLLIPIYVAHRIIHLVVFLNNSPVPVTWSWFCIHKTS